MMIEFISCITSFLMGVYPFDLFLFINHGMRHFPCSDALVSHLKWLNKPSICMCEDIISFNFLRNEHINCLLWTPIVFISQSAQMANGKYCLQVQVCKFIYMQQSNYLLKRQNPFCKLTMNNSKTNNALFIISCPWIFYAILSNAV